MTGLTSTSYLWREPQAHRPFHTGISLHSHTSCSHETLDFIAELSTDWPWLQPLIRAAEQRCERLSGITPDYSRAFWTPPLAPVAALDLESAQINALLDKPALVSLSDHDTLRAPELLRSAGLAPEMPLSVEWSVPFACTHAGTPLSTSFHLGIHNLPASAAAAWMTCFSALTSTDAPTPESALRRDALLHELLAALHDLPDVLVVFNHPLWHLFRIGTANHGILVGEFLRRHGQFLHALELNGLRNWKENHAVRELASRWNMLPISGGDRHGLEPNANLNLSAADTFAGFVHEVRRERRSHILFVPQYAEPWKHRILQSTLDAIRNHPHLPEGSRRWDDRVFHPASDGSLRPLSSLWTSGAPTPLVSAVLALVRALGSRPVSRTLRFTWGQNRTESHARRLSLAHIRP